MPLINLTWRLQAYAEAVRRVDERLLKMRQVRYLPASQHDLYPNGLPPKLERLLEELEAKGFLTYYKRLVHLNRDDFVIVSKGAEYAIVWECLKVEDADFVYFELLYRHVRRGDKTTKLWSVVRDFEEASFAAKINGIFFKVQPICLSDRLPFRNVGYDEEEYLVTNESLARYYCRLGYVQDEDDPLSFWKPLAPR